MKLTKLIAAAFTTEPCLPTFQPCTDVVTFHHAYNASINQIRYVYDNGYLYNRWTRWGHWVLKKCSRTGNTVRLGRPGLLGASCPGALFRASGVTECKLSWCPILYTTMVEVGRWTVSVVWWKLAGGRWKWNLPPQPPLPPHH